MCYIHSCTSILTTVGLVGAEAQLEVGEEVTGVRAGVVVQDGERVGVTVLKGTIEGHAKVEAEVEAGVGTGIKRAGEETRADLNQEDGAGRVKLALLPQSTKHVLLESQVVKAVRNEPCDLVQL